MKPSHQMISLFGIVLALGLAPAAAGGAEDPEWWDDDLAARVARVSDGELAFLATPPAKKVHHHHNSLVIEAWSLEDGWLRLEQCHEHLDAVPRAEVVYREGNIRKLVVTEQKHIGAAWVEGPSVQLKDVEPGARLCVSAESRALLRNEDGSFSVRNGPFMRRFLDGYYPMHVTMDIHYPCDRLRVAAVTPEAQPGFVVTTRPCQVSVDTWFEGRLHTEVRLEPSDTDEVGVP